MRRDQEIQQKRALTQFTRRQNTEAAEKESEHKTAERKHDAVERERENT